MGVLLGYVWTEAVTVKIFTRFQIYTGTCGRGLKVFFLTNYDWLLETDGKYQLKIIMQALLQWAFETKVIIV